MNLIVKNIQNKEVWEKFLLDCQEKTFLQSWNWGEFQKIMGNKIWRLGIYEGEKLISVALVVKVSARRGTYLNIPHGPVSDLKDNDQILEVILKELNKISKEEKADFIRVSPIWERSEENERAFKVNGFREAPMHEHAESSWKLGINPLEDELLNNMRKTTRYLIRQAQKNKDINVSQSYKVEAVEIFDNLYQEVVKVQHFTPFSLNYLKAEFVSFNEDNQIALFFGEYKGETVASAFVIFWSNIGFYHHAALLPKFHKVPVSYLLQWEAIKEARKRGCVLYDFWGYVPPKSKHPWAGPTLFKMGFGGKAYEYVKTQDFPLNKKYYLTYIFEKLRKTRRGL